MHISKAFTIATGSLLALTVLVIACDPGSDAASPTPAASPFLANSTGPSAELATTPAAGAPTNDPAEAPTLGNGLRADAIGPLVVYAHVTSAGGAARAPEATWDVTAVVTYDEGARSELGRFELSGREADVRVLGMREETILVARRPVVDGRPEGDASVVGYDLAGNEVSRLDAFSLRAIEPVLSPDGTRITGVSRCGEEHCLVIADALTGEALLARSTTVDADGKPFFLQPRAWTVDNDELFATGHFLAGNDVRLFKVTTDGEVEDQEVPHVGSLSSDGHSYASLGDAFRPWVEDAIGCSLYQVITIHNLTEHRSSIEVGHDGFAIASPADLEWSPDGREVLYPLRRRPPPADEPCSVAFVPWTSEPQRWVLLDAETGAGVEIADPEAVRASWFAESPTIEALCDGARQVFILDRQLRVPRACATQAGAQLKQTILIDGEPILAVEATDEVVIVGVLDGPVDD
jgi:hypothetical protein